MSGGRGRGGSTGGDASAADRRSWANARRAAQARASRVITVLARSRLSDVVASRGQIPGFRTRSDQIPGFTTARPDPRLHDATKIPGFRTVGKF